MPVTSTEAASPPPADPRADMHALERPVEPASPDGRPLPSLFRNGLVASVVCHAVLILWGVGIWDSARPLAAMPPPSIAVDLVSSEEAPGEPGQPDAAAPSPPAISVPQQQAAVALPDLLRPSTTVAQPPAPVSRGVALPAEPPPDSIDAKVAMANRLAETLMLPVALGGRGDFDTSPADKRARIGRDVVAEFKDHLRKCWSPADPEAPARLRILVRVVFNRDGRLLKDPMLIQAVASPYGPALVQGAIKALHDCQPYAFLPADTYDEWKVMDIGFSPQGIL